MPPITVLPIASWPKANPYSLDNPDRVPSALDVIEDTPLMKQDVSDAISFLSEYWGETQKIYHYLGCNSASSVDSKYLRESRWMCQVCLRPYKGIPVYVKDVRSIDRRATKEHQERSAKTNALIWYRKFPVEADPWNPALDIDPYAGTVYARDGPTPSLAFTGKPTLYETEESKVIRYGKDSEGRLVRNGLVHVFPKRFDVDPPARLPAAEYLKMLPDPPAVLAKEGIRLQKSNPMKTAKTTRVMLDNKSEAIIAMVYEDYPMDENSEYDSEGNRLNPNAKYWQESSEDGPRYKCQSHPGKVQNDVWSCCRKSVYWRGGCVLKDRHPEMWYWNFNDSLQKLWKCHKLDFNKEGQCDLVTLSASFGVNIRGEPEVVRVVVLEFYSGQILIDSLVSPSTDMMHYNTPRTGITHAMMAAAKESGQAIESYHKFREMLGNIMRPGAKMIMWNGAETLKCLRIVNDTLAPMVIELLHSEWSTGEHQRPPNRKKLKASSCPEQAWLKPSLKQTTKLRLRREIGQSRKFREDALENAMACRDLFAFYVKMFGRQGFFKANRPDDTDKGLGRGRDWRNSPYSKSNVIPSTPEVWQEPAEPHFTNDVW